ncbi:MAG: hypothetical protein EXX96DRAFT_583369, partial [Benjaminiella poitrasii]
MPSTTVATTATMQQKRSRSTKPKLFQCTGFGDCHMVFTRSEHLARHTRKHTGEKPYLCIVPGCTRRFSRFDNMMQHTQTHKATRNKSPSATTEASSSTYHCSAPKTSSSTTSIVNTYDKAPKFIMSNHPNMMMTDSSSSDEESSSSSSTSSSHSHHMRDRIAVNHLCQNQQQQHLHPILPSTATSSAPSPPLLKELHLTQDEFEALQGFGRFKHTPIFIDSFRDLASVVYIEPNPVR